MRIKETVMGTISKIFDHGGYRLRTKAVDRPFGKERLELTISNATKAVQVYSKFKEMFPEMYDDNIMYLHQRLKKIALIDIESDEMKNLNLVERDKIRATVTNGVTVLQKLQEAIDIKLESHTAPLRIKEVIGAASAIAWEKPKEP